MNQFKKKFQPPYKKGFTNDAQFIPVATSEPIPSEIDVESAVLGAILLESTCLDIVSKDLNRNLFYVAQNAIICDAIIFLYGKNIPVDILTVKNQVTAAGYIDFVGGASYIVSLTTVIASAANIEHHIKILQQESLKRTIIKTCGEGMQKAFAAGEDVFDVYADLQNKLDTALKDLMTFEIESVGKINDALIKESYEINKKGIKSGVQSGLTLLDNETSGWQKSDLIIVAGRPGMGKTAISVCLAVNPAILYKIPTAIFSLEMSKEQLVGRIQSGISGISASKITKKQLTKQEINIIAEKCSIFDNAPLYIDDTPALSLQSFRSKARKLVKDLGVQLIVIDYLQLMISGLDKFSREQEIGTISRGLKSIAKELGVPIIALSQLSRAVESRPDKKPMLSDLRESGAIEQDADMVLFCWRPIYYGIEQYEIEGKEMDTSDLFMFLLAKHRNGGLGEFPLKFIKELTKIVNHPMFENDYMAPVEGFKSAALQNARDNEFDVPTTRNEEVPF